MASINRCHPKGFNKKQQIRYRIQQAKIFIATIGERGVMKTRIFGLAVILSLSAILGACGEGGEQPGGSATSSPAASPAEPTDSGATKTPASAAPTTAPASPAATTAPASPGATTKATPKKKP